VISARPDQTTPAAPEVAGPIDQFVAVGDQVAGFRLEELAGAGGMGIVFRASEPGLERAVAVKLILPELARDPRFRELFIRESMAAAGLEHPNAIPIYRAGEDEAGRLFIAMRYVEGETLAQLIARQGRLAPARACRIVAQVAAALDAAHARGLVHRDVKPANVLIADPEGEEHVYLSDFGVSAWRSEPLDGSRLVGTPPYLAPEQIRRGRIDASTDVYALGCLLFECLTGRPPYTGMPRDGVLAAHLTAPVPVPSHLVPDLPRRFDQVIARALAKRPEARHQSAGALAMDALGARFGVFLVHEPRDAAAVSALGATLRAAAVEPWIAAEQLRAGASRSELVREGMRASDRCAVVVGPAGLGPWAREELAVARRLAEQDRAFTLTLVLLPGAPDPFHPTLAFLAGEPWVDLRAGIDDPAGLDELVRAFSRTAAARPPLSGTDPQTVPYRGLEPFGEQDAALFFGRDDAVRRIGERLREGRFLAVVGASGSGKTSLLRAGLVPALRRDADAAGQRLSVGWMTPGARPLASLAAQMHELIGSDAAEALAGAIETDSTALDAALSACRGDVRVLLIVDQFEELYTLGAGAAQRRAFVEALLFAANIPGGRLALVIGIRADFYEHLAEDPQLRELAAASQFLLGPLGRPELRRVIEAPARACGLELEEGLTRRILADVGDGPGTLPLLEHLLLEVWRRRRRNTLTLEAYAAAGGVEGALAKRANGVFEALGPGEQTIAQRVLLRLIQPGEAAEDTRRRAPLAELAGAVDDRAALDAVVDTLAGSRLLTVGQDPVTGTPTVEITHEALIRGWPRLRGWIDQEREYLRLERRLTEATAEWEASRRAPGLLYRQARLGAWADRDLGGLSDQERAFLEASRAEAEREIEEIRERARRDARTARRLRALLGGALGLLVLAGVAALIAFEQRSTAQEATRTTDAGRLAALSGSVSADQPDTSLLLAIEGVREQDTPTTRGALLTALTDRPTLLAFIQEQRHVLGAAIAPHRPLVALAAGHAVEIWRVTSGRPRLVRRFPLARPDATTAMSVAFARDGRLFAADDRGRLYAWTGAPAWRQLFETEHIRGAPSLWSVAISPDQRLLATGGDDGVDHVFSARTGKLLRSLPGFDAGSFQVAFSPDGRFLAGTSDDAVTLVWRTRDWRRAAPPLIGTGGGWGVAFQPSGRLMATGDDGGVALWNTRTWHRSGKELNGNQGTVISLVFAERGSTLLAGGQDGRVLTWDLESRQPIGDPLVGHASSVNAMAVDERTGLLVTAGDERAGIWSLNGAGALARPLPNPGGTTGRVAVAGNGRLIATVGDEGIARLWDPLTLRLVREIRVDRAPVRSVSLDEDGRLLAVGDDAGLARVWDTRTGRPVTPPLPAAQQRVSGVALNGPGTLLATAGDDAVAQGRVSLWRLGAGKPRAQILHTSVNKGAPPQVAYATAVAFSRDGRLLLVGNNNNYLDVFRVDGLERLRSFDTLRGVRAVAISPDGKQVADGGTNGPVLIYDLRTGRQVWAFQGHHGRVTGLSFSPDGRMLASTSPDDHTLRLWDLKAGVPFGNPIATGISEPAPLGWTPDGRQLVAPTTAGAAVFNMNESTWQPAACAVAGRNMTRAEWERYLPGTTYRATCPGFPLDGS